MAATGNSFETPHACPFVALELDRDRRADKPDYRHRCFAEPTPAPRSLAHQEAYCLSPNFAGCPIFQDWAVRAAARPTATTGSAMPGAAGVAGVLATAAAGGSDADEVAPAPPEITTPPPAAAPASVSAATDLPEDASVTPAGAALAAAAAASTGVPPAAAASPPTFATTGWEEEAPDNEQLGAFDAPVAGAAAAAAGATPASRGDWPTSAPADEDARSSYGELDAGYPEPPVEPAFVPPPVQPSSSNRQEAAAAAAVPAFLAGRSPRPADSPSYSASSTPPPRPTPPPAREEIVPSWEIDGRYGAEMPLDKGSGGGSRFDGILTAVAVVAILAIGVAAVLFLPGLLNNKGAAPKTPAPSFAAASGLPPTVAPSVVVSLAPSSVPSAVAPTAVPTTPPSVGPEATPHLYRIKPGDSLARIANKFDVTVQQILDANPQITDPDHILVGFTIIIPPAVQITIPPTAAP